MRIAIATEFFFPHIGGTEVRLLEIAKRLVRRGHEVHVFTVKYDRERPGEDDKDGIQVHRYAFNDGYATSNGFRSIRGVFGYALATMVKAAAADFDVWYFGQWPMIHSLFSRALVSPLVQEWCEVWLHRIVPLERVMARATVHHVAVGESVKRRLIEFLRVRAEDIAVIRSGVDVERLRCDGTDKKWGKIVYLGRMAPHKRLDLLLGAYRLAKNEAPEIELHLAGSGPSFESLSKEAAKLDDVHMHGRISDDEKEDLLRTAWLFVMPSEREGLPHAPVEAMAAGTPVVTVNYPDNGTVDICSEGNGVVTTPEPRAIANAIRRTLLDEGSWREMSAHARQFAAKFSWENSTNEFEQYLTSVVDHSR